MERFRLSPLIRFTLLSLYAALVLPLPLLAPAELRLWMVVGLLAGLVLVLGLLSEQVETDDDCIRVRYPAWIRWLLRRGWVMRWQDIRALVPVGTSQGGTVYYLKATDLRHQLLPQRIERFDRFLQLVSERTIVKTAGIGRLTPPWTYQVLAVISAGMVLMEATAAFAISNGWISLPEGYPG
ncbi:hypothetical protein SynA15127_01783 [Synechococcus sp. A15-127]|uniref:hypothetical protein n=1 Tax=Synechococcus sp. A15-127 TaxID=1050624 RepID=UPI001646C645|nr:hypothetical protein [Synechococcus sp. A15-127]QNI94859.1 hypothetical protein SynA15127_01783 [Synechococcus sp. A15-127]